MVLKVLTVSLCQSCSGSNEASCTHRVVTALELAPIKNVDICLAKQDAVVELAKLIPAATVA